MNVFTKPQQAAVIVAVLFIVVVAGSYLFWNKQQDVQQNVNTPVFVDNILAVQEKNQEATADVETTTERTVRIEKKDTTNEAIQQEDATLDIPVIEPSTQKLAILKDVGEPYLDYFGLTKADFIQIKNAGFDILQSNFDICAYDEDVQFFLDSAYAAGLKVIMPAGAGEAEWGYPCDEDFSNELKPSWQSDAVERWVKKWKNHPAIYAWDISNEAGQNFPNALRNDDTWIAKGFALSLQQLQTAYADVKAADPSRPIMIRMNGWFFYDYESNFFREGNPFAKNVADIVMVNAYANVDEYFDDFVSTVTKRTISSVQSIDPNVAIITALGVWEEPPMWELPSVDELQNDYQQAYMSDILGIAYFKYGARGTEWFLPTDAPVIWNKIIDLQK